MTTLYRFICRTVIGSVGGPFDMAAPAWFTGQNMMRITGAAYIMNGLMACFFGDFFMEQSFGAWIDDPEANELGLYLLDALGGILIGFGIFIVMASLANGRLRCQSIARVIVLASGPALVVSVLHRMMTDFESTIIIIQLIVLMSAMLGASFVEVEDAPPVIKV